MVGGKAKLLREDYCDGLGDCLPACPADAIRFEEREAPAYDAKAVEAGKKATQKEKQSCPGHRPRSLEHQEPCAAAPAATSARPVSRLRQWPCQIKLLPVDAPYFDASKLLIAADCTAYAYAGTHEEFMKGRITLIGCPKLDDVDYSEKLTEIFRRNDIRSVTVLRMEVPCCGGLEFAVKKALQASGKMIPWRVVTVSCDGELLED
jgi:ferredoxin